MDATPAARPAPEIGPPRTREPWLVPYRLTWAGMLLFFVAFYTLLVPLPLYLRGLGLPDWQVGWILGAFGAAALVVRPLTGVAADRWGHRAVMLAGAASLACGSAGASLTGHPGLLFGARVLQAAGYVAFTTAATALVVDLAPAVRRGAVLAVFGVAANLAMALTPAVVDASLTRLTLVGALRLSAALAVLAGVAALLVPAVTAGTRGAAAGPPGGPLGGPPGGVGAWPLRIPPGVAPLMLAAGIFGVGYGAFLQFLPLLAATRGLGAAGTTYAVYGAGIILTRLVVGRLLDRGDRARMLAPLYLLMAASLAAFALAGSVWTLMAAALGMAAVGGTLHPGLIAMHVDRAAPGERARAIARFYLGFDLGIGGGAWLLAPVFQWLGLGGLYLGAAAIGVLGVPLMRRVALQAARGQAKVT